MLFLSTHFSDIAELALDLLGMVDMTNNDELRKLASKVPNVIKNSISANTFKTYFTRFKKWSTWCRKFDFKIYPVDSKCLLLFIADLVDKKVSVPVLNTVIFSISWVHSLGNVKDPCKSPVVSKMLEGARRTLAKPSIQKESLSLKTMSNFILQYGYDKKNLINLRFAAMCVPGFYGFLRFSEIVNLRRSDLKFIDKHIEMFIEKSKTDKYRHGTTVFISVDGNK